MKILIFENKGMLTYLSYSQLQQKPFGTENYQHGKIHGQNF